MINSELIESHMEAVYYDDKEEGGKWVSLAYRRTEGERGREAVGCPDRAAGIS